MDKSLVVIGRHKIQFDRSARQVKCDQCHDQGWGRLQKPDYDYSCNKIIDYDYHYDFSGD